MIAAWGWREAIGLLGVLGMMCAAAILVALGGARAKNSVPAPASRPVSGSATPNWRAFASLSTIGVVDSGVRTAFLTFLPFLLTEKGVSVPMLGVALGLIFF